ncbi:unnamed protein product [Chondrus crispus]|uniref:DNA-(apurinic or apyrimidinic site) endonuclease n=1 Tax=Chondrus crispus TaxID=2769 RepID=R7QGE2_CHOCR|nr:unnamed protein product [Chondrus crispus]CDF37159.1 unnamed protein product [Chondrus crispus]|eukprot:XP_005716978.1 unnamed protein product [Chondrus crispus]
MKSPRKRKRPLSDSQRTTEKIAKRNHRPAKPKDDKKDVDENEVKVGDQAISDAMRNNCAAAAEPENAVENEGAPDRPWGALDDPHKLKVITWNVASCRSMIKNGSLLRYIQQEAPDILCLQETKMTDKAVKEFPEVAAYDVHWNHSEKKGYSGVAILVRRDLDERKKVRVKRVEAGIGLAEADKEGRVLVCYLSSGAAIVNAYVPNSGQKLARLEFRTKEFEAGLRKFLDDLAKEHRVVYCGDLNVAHNEIDIHNSKANRKNAGHTPEEREEFSKLLSSGEGWVDSFRELYPSVPGYTYFSRRFGAKLKNEGKGWRLDYHVIDKASFKSGVVGDVYVRTQVEGSDHYPVVLEYRFGESG